MSIFSNLLAAGLSVLNDVAGDAVVYQRGNVEIAWRARQGAMSFDSTDTNSLTVTSRTKDFIGQAATLVINDEPIEPTEGDRIVLAGVTYEVIRPSGQNCWYFVDPANSELRIHTQQIPN